MDNMVLLHSIYCIRKKSMEYKVIICLWQCSFMVKYFPLQLYLSHIFSKKINNISNTTEICIIRRLLEVVTQSRLPFGLHVQWEKMYQNYKNVASCYFHYYSNRLLQILQIYLNSLSYRFDNVIIRKYFILFFVVTYNLVIAIKTQL